MTATANRQTLASPMASAIWRALGVVAALLMDVCWVAAWLRLLTADQVPPPPVVFVVWLTVLGGTSYAIGRLSQRLYLKSVVQQALGGIALVLAFLLSLDVVEGSLRGLDLLGALAHLSSALAHLLPVPAEAWIFLAVVVLWQRGTSLAGTPELNWGREGLHFRLGVVLYAVYIAVRSDFEGAPIPELLPTFFLASLLAMAVARANGLTHQPGGSRAPITPGWMAGLTALLALATAAGVVAGLALNSHAAHQVALLAGVGVGVVLGLLFRLLLPLLMLLNPVVQILVDWLRQLFNGLGEVMAQVQVNSVPDAAAPTAERAAAPPWLQALAAAWPYLQWVLVLLGVGLVIALVTRGRRRIRADEERWMQRDEDLEPGSILPAESGLVAQTWTRLKGWIQAGAARPWLTTLVIRRIYSAMLAKAARDGRARRADETPAEYQEALAVLYPTESESSKEITGAFELMRYGLRPEDPQTVDRVRAAWARLKQVAP